jgi:HAMP domain-containing protein
MLRKLGSLRARLALTFVVIAGMINAVIGLTGVAVREREIRDAFDAQLHLQAEVIITTLERLGTGWPDADVVRVIEDLNTGPSDVVYFVQLRDVDSNRLFRSHSLGEQAMPIVTTADQTFDDGQSRLGFVAVTHRGGWVDHVLPAGDELRRVTVHYQSPSGMRYIVNVGASYDPVNQAIALLQGVFWAGMLISLFATGIASWIVADRALGRLNLVRRLLQELSPQDLGRRVEVGTNASVADEIGAMTIEVNEMLARLETSFNAQERFVADASHELRTPIATILSQAQVLQLRDRSIQEYRDFAASVAEEMQRLSKIVDSLLSLVRLQDGGKLQHRVEVSMNDVAMDAVEHCHAFTSPWRTATTAPANHWLLETLVCFRSWSRTCFATPRVSRRPGRPLMLVSVFVATWLSCQYATADRAFRRSI